MLKVIDFFWFFILDFFCYCCCFAGVVSAGGSLLEGACVVENQPIAPRLEENQQQRSWESETKPVSKLFLFLFLALFFSFFSRVEEAVEDFAE